MLAEGTLFQGRYRIVRPLAQGGMGTVYEAADERLETRVALKENHFKDDRLIKQFEREARLLARLRHPSLTKVIDHFIEGQGQFLVMEFIPGEDLASMLERRRGPFPIEEVLNWADQLLDALEYLHGQNPPVVHRDIKPQNLKITDRNQIILLDFGLAKGYSGRTTSGTTSSSVFGYTPNYAPLEQIESEGTDVRSDLYSAAATIYHLITGVSPPGALTRVSATSNGQSDPLRKADAVNSLVPAGVAVAIERAMSIPRNKRPASASEFRALLKAEATRAKPPRKRRLKATVVDPPAPSLPSTVASPTQDTTIVRAKAATAKAEKKKTPTRGQEPTPTLVADWKPKHELATSPATATSKTTKRKSRPAVAVVITLAVVAFFAYYYKQSEERTSETSTLQTTSPTPISSPQEAASPSDGRRPYLPPAPALGPATAQNRAHDPDQRWCNFENPIARAAPSVNSRDIGRCDCGHAATIVARQSDWAKINFYDFDGSPAQGWVPMSTLNEYSHCP